MPYTKQDYINAVKDFNAVNSFQLLLPDDDEEDMYTRLAIRFTKIVKDMKIRLEKYEIGRKNGTTDIAISTSICAFVVHINQITNHVKQIDEPIATFC